MAKIRKPKPKKTQRPKIDYPPVPTRKWIPPDKRTKPPKPEPAYKKPEQLTVKLKISSLKKIWHQFDLIGNIGTLLGDYSQTHKKFTFKTNGYQGACNCAVACIFANLFKMSKWNRFTINRILDMGDDLYIKTTQQPGDTCIVEVPPKKVFNSFFMEREKINFYINDESKIVGKTVSVAEEKVKESFKEPLENFFKQFSSGIFSLGGKDLAIRIQENAYYLFDPTEHDANGDPWKGIPGWGFSIVYRCKTLEDLIDQIYKNVKIQSQNTEFEIYGCTIQRIVKINVNPPENFEDVIAAAKEESPTLEDEFIGEPPVDVIAKKSIIFLEGDITSQDVRIEELSPEIVDPSKSIQKRPSWLGEGPVTKFDLCKLPIPEKVFSNKISYYTEIIPGKIGILRGTTCQTDRNLSKYEGRQSMGNAISALIMLRLYNSVEWVPNIINTILKNGDLLYRNAMVSIPRTQSLKLSNFQRKTEYEGRFFLPLIEEYSVVGKLRSQDYDVLDLLPALESFLTDNDCCVIVGPTTLAVWIENGHYFMLDPNERDKDGKAMKKTLSFSNDDIFPLNFTPGSACVVWFSDLKDLVELYMYNVEKSQKESTFHLNKVRIDDYVPVPENWYNFKGLEPGKWILRGTLSQSSKKFPRISRNWQGPSISLVALAFTSLVPLKEWSESTVDEVVEHGDKHYQKSLEYLQKNETFDKKWLLLSEILPKCRLLNKQVQFRVEECFLNGVINSKGQNDLMDLNRGLEIFFDDNASAVITCRNISIAVWKSENFYYSFDSHDRDEHGFVTNYGAACVIRANDLQDLTNQIEANFGPDKEDLYNINRVNLSLYEFGEGESIEPPLNFYTKVSPEKAIIRSLYSEISPKYGINSGKQTLPMCLTALALNRLKPAADWAKTDIDEILNKGDQLYLQTMNDIQKEEFQKQMNESEGSERTELPVETNTGLESDDNGNRGSGDTLASRSFNIRMENVKKEFNIGFNKFDVEFQDLRQGNIKKGLVRSLKNVLKTFQRTEESPYQELILETKPLSVAIWRDENLFYMFDSKPRDKNGRAVNIEQWLELSEFDKLNVIKSPPPPVETREGITQVEDEESERKEAKSVTILEGGERDAEFERETNVVDLQPLPEGEPAFFQYYEQHGEEEGGLSGEEDMLERRYPLINKNSSYWLEREKAGKSCAMWFTNPDSLVLHVYNNIPAWEAKNEDFLLRSIKMKNTVQTKDTYKPDQERRDMYQGNWYSFVEVEYGKWILRGTMTIFGELFPESNRGKQLIPTCFTALAIARIFGMLCFNNASVDTILSYGDKLFTFVKKMRKQQILQNNPKNLSRDEVDWMLEHEEFEVQDVPKKICISQFLVSIELNPEVIKGDIKAQNFEEIMDLHQGLVKFFESMKYGILQAKGLSVAIWRGQKTFYLFDGLSRGPNGISSPFGTACVLRYLDIKKMADDFLQNIPQHGKNAFVIHSVSMNTSICPRERQPTKMIESVPTAKEGGFKYVVPGKNIVCGSISQEDPKFDKDPGELSASIAVVALSMTLMHKTKTWSKPIIDDIIELGNELYEESKGVFADEFDPWEDKIDLEKIKKDFNIGLMQVNFELRLRSQSGIFDSKRSVVPNLRKCIEEFFEENTHGVLVSDPITLAMWEECNSDPVIYIFDPNPRSSTGMPLFTGTACLLSFVNASLAAEHVISCFSQPDYKNSTFTIFPVEIIVGSKKAIKKVKKGTSRSEVSVLPRCSKNVASKEKKLVRKIDEKERERRELKRLDQLGRKYFFTLPNGDAILRGNRISCSEICNRADISYSVIGIVMHHLTTVDNWKSTHIDLICETGDQLYIDSYIAYGPRDEKLGLENVIRKFYMNNLRIHITIYKPIISDMFIISKINNVLQAFFQQETYCIFSFLNQWMSLFFKSGVYYMFDPHECNLQGDRVQRDESGSVVLMKFVSLERLASKVFQNLFIADGSSDTMFTIWLIDVNIKS